MHKIVIVLSQFRLTDRSILTFIRLVLRRTAVKLIMLIVDVIENRKKGSSLDFLQFFPQCLAVDAQNLGGPGFVAVSAFQNSQDMCRLHLSQ